MSSKVVFGVYKLPNELRISEDCLGITEPVNISFDLQEYKTHVILPIRDPSASKSWVNLVCPEEIPRFFDFEGETAPFGTELGQSAFSLKRVIFRWEIRSSKISLNKERSWYEGMPIDELIDSIPQWWTKVENCIQIFSKQDVRPYPGQAIVHVNTAAWSCWCDNNEAVHSNTKISLCNVGDVLCKKGSVSKELLLRSLRESDKEFGASHYLLRSATLLHNNKILSAIEAGLAVEIAIQNFATAKGITLSKKPTLGEVIGKLSDPRFPQSLISLSSAVDLETHLLTVRNDAAHRNKIPTDAELKQLLNLAQSIVDILEPL